VHLAPITIFSIPTQIYVQAVYTLVNNVSPILNAYLVLMLTFSSIIQQHLHAIYVIQQWLIAFNVAVQLFACSARLDILYTIHPVIYILFSCMCFMCQN